METVDPILRKLREALAVGRKPEECGEELDALLGLDAATLTTVLALFLESSDEDWRREAFDHLSSETLELLPKVRDILGKDPDPSIRTQAATALGILSSRPEPALFASLGDDPDADVRVTALFGYLSLAGIPVPIVQQEVARFGQGEMRPDRTYVEALIREHGSPALDEPQSERSESGHELVEGFARRHIVAWDLVESQIRSAITNRPLPEVIRWLTERLHPPATLDQAGVRTALALYLEDCFNDVDNVWVGPAELLPEHARPSDSPSPFAPSALSDRELSEAADELSLLAGFSSYYAGLGLTLSAAFSGDAEITQRVIQGGSDWRRVRSLSANFHATGAGDGKSQDVNALIARADALAQALTHPREGAVPAMPEAQEALAQLARAGAIADAHEEDARLVAQLCAASSQPALERFAAWTRNEKKGWRILGLRGLASAATLSRDKLELVRSVVVTDSSPDVRAAAATALAVHSQWPDGALTNRIRNEKDPSVLLRVVESTLVLARLPYHMVQAELDRVERGEVGVSEASIELVTQRYADSLRQDRGHAS